MIVVTLCDLTHQVVAIRGLEYEGNKWEQYLWYCSGTSNDVPFFLS